MFARVTSHNGGKSGGVNPSRITNLGKVTFISDLWR